MRTLAKVAGGLLLAGLILAAAAPFLLKKFLPPERVKALVVAQAQKALGREVRLAGVSYGLKGVSLEELAVSEKPAFAQGTFVSVKTFKVRAALLPLLKKTLVVDRVEADGLSVTVIKNADGSYNFSDLVAPAPAPPSGGTAAPSQPKGQDFSLGVQAAAVTGGAVLYKDLGAGDELKVSGLNLKAKGLKLSGPFHADFSASVKGVYQGRPLDASAALSGSFDLGGQDPRKLDVDLKKLDLEYLGYRAKGSLSAKGLEDTQAKADLLLFKGQKDLGRLEWDGRIKRAPVLELKGRLKAETQSLRMSDFADLGAPKSGLIPPLRLSGGLSYKPGTAALEKFEIATPVGKAVVDGGASGLGTPKLSPDVSADLDLDLPEISYAQLPAGLLPKGMKLPPMAVTGKVKIKGDAAVLEKLKARLKQGTVEATGSVAGLRSAKPDADLAVAVDLDVPELAAADLPFLSLPKGFVSPAVKVDGAVKVRGDDAELEGLKLRGKAGTLEVSGKIRSLTKEPEPNLDLTAKLSLPQLTNADAPFLPLPPGFKLPPSRWDVDVSASRDQAVFRAFRAVVGSNDVEIEKGGKVMGLRAKPVADLTIKCRQFVLEELGDLTTAIHEMKVKGNGFFALTVHGPAEKPVLSGKLQFRTLSAVVSGLSLEGFTGTASFDERRIDVPNLKGKVEGGELKLDLTVKNYAAKPDVDLEASLTEFDLGKFFSAKTSMAAKADAKAQAQGKPKPSDKPAQPVHLRGKFTVGRLFHPNFEAKDVRSSWDLKDYTPDYKRLGGWARFNVAQGGYLKDLGSAAASSKMVKVLLMPLIVIQKIGRLVGRSVFPNFDDVSYTELAGDYAFTDGLMRLNTSHLNANVADVNATGTLNLPTEAIDMNVVARVAGVPVPVEIAVGGTFESPKHRVKVEKALQDAGKQLIEGLLKRR